MMVKTHRCLVVTIIFFSKENSSKIFFRPEKFLSTRNIAAWRRGPLQLDGPALNSVTSTFLRTTRPQGRIQRKASNVEDPGRYHCSNFGACQVWRVVLERPRLLIAERGRGPSTTDLL